MHQDENKLQTQSFFFTYGMAYISIQKFFNQFQEKKGISHVESYPLRVEYLRKAASLIEECIFDPGAAMALKVGKNRMESLGDVQETADLIYYSCHQMEKNNGHVVEMGKDPLVGYESTNVSVLRPYGVWR